MHVRTAIMISLAVGSLAAGSTTAWAATATAAAATAAAAAAATTSAVAEAAAAPEGAPGVDDATVQLFVTKCASCHTVGKGARVGPDLAGAHERRSVDWLTRFIGDPESMLSSDPDARTLLTEFKGVRMPALGLNAAEIESLVELITICSGTACNLVGQFVPVTDSTPEDAAFGKELFLGLVAFKNGAPACNSCHTVRGISSTIGGGQLAKDLTHAFGVVGDEGLDAALKSPTFPLMNKVFADHPLETEEVFALRSFLYQANRTGPGEDGGYAVLLAALLGTLLAMVVLNAAWGRRLADVRSSVVSGRKG